MPWNEMEGFMHVGGPMHGTAPSTNLAQKVAVTDLSHVGRNPCL